MGKTPVIGENSRPAYRRLYTFTYRVINYGAGYGGPHAKTGRKIGSYVVFTPGNVEGVCIGLGKGDNTRIKPGDQGSKGQKVMFCAFGLKDLKCSHRNLSMIFPILKLSREPAGRFLDIAVLIQHIARQNPDS
jgi:hypothetical protein